ncbi:MAG: S-layer homology domain-containing protein [Oscillospiraceae bacterium]|jgi:hypothetical protein|nr:S-layer homology domain-containing protein [Oscillospiraceae bacterium]
MLNGLSLLAHKPLFWIIVVVVVVVVTILAAFDKKGAAAILAGIGVLVGIVAIIVTMPETPHGGSYATPTFKDVYKTDPFYSAVEYVAERQLMLGDSDGKFNPTATVTNAELVAVLGRLAGVDRSLYVPQTADYLDVSTSDEYAPYIHWAIGYGVICNFDSVYYPSDPYFNPESGVTASGLQSIIRAFAFAFTEDTETEDTMLAVSELYTVSVHVSRAQLAQIVRDVDKANIVSGPHVALDWSNTLETRAFATNHSDEQISHGGWNEYSWVFKNPVPNCKGFTYEYTLSSAGYDTDISDMLSGEIFDIFVLSDDNEWIWVWGFYAIKDEAITTHVRIDEVMTVKAVLCHPRGSGAGKGNYNRTLSITNLIYSI